MSGGRRHRAIGLSVRVSASLAAIREPRGIRRHSHPPTARDQRSSCLRLMYPSLPYAKFEFRGRRDWREGGTSWTEDYPRADRHFIVALRRLSRINARGLEQPVNPDDVDDIYNWPWMYTGLTGNWDLTDEQAAKIREFLLRGGFLYADDFWGPDEWHGFEAGMKKIFPNDRAIQRLK